MRVLQRRQITLLLLSILGVIIWGTRAAWLPTLDIALSWFGDTASDRQQALDSTVNLVSGIYQVVMIYLLWLTRTPPTAAEPLMPLKPTTWPCYGDYSRRKVQSLPIRSGQPK